jgi:hypothetical protein
MSNGGSTATKEETMKSTTFLAAVSILTASAGGYALVGRATETGEPARSAITKADLDRSSAENIFDVVEELRPEWLARDSSLGDAKLPTVYIELRCPDVMCLRWLESDRIYEVRYLDPSETGQVWSPAQPGGAIVVTLRSRATAEAGEPDR